MWFKNANIYRMTSPFTLSAAELAARLTPQAFAPCGNLDMQSIGWVPVRDGGELVHAVGRQMLLALCVEKKLLPSYVINEAARVRAGELEEQQGFKPGRRQMREIKEAVTDELLPRAFTSKALMHVWLDPVNGWLVVDAASANRCDEVFKLLLKSLEVLPFASLRTERSPLSAMTDWLAADEAPAGFTVDNQAELRATGEGKATVKYIRHSLEVDDIRTHIAGGKQCVNLALTWADRVSFVLTESLTVKRIEPLDVLKENTAETVANADERFDTDFALMVGEFDKLFTDLVGALGGYEVQQ